MGTGVDNGAPPPGPPWNPRPHPRPPAPPQSPATAVGGHGPSAGPYGGAAHRTAPPPPRPAAAVDRGPYAGPYGPAAPPPPPPAAVDHDPYAGTYGGARDAGRYATAGPAAHPTAPPQPRNPYAAPPPPSHPPHPFTGFTGHAQQPPYPAPAAPAPAPGGRWPRGTGRVRPATGVCLVLGAGLLCGAAAGDLLGGATTPADQAARAFTAGRDLWHDQPVDTLFPRTIHGGQAGPGGADRTWTRVGVAPDSDCSHAFDPALTKALSPVGCLRLLRATYTDATSTDVTTVGILVTRATPAGMTALRTRLTHSGTAVSPSAVPLPVAFPGTPAAGFGPAQRGSWTVDVSTSLPVVVYAVSGFADGRALPAPQPASAADVPGATTTAAQAGLGFEADGLADAVTGRLTHPRGVSGAGDAS